MTKKTRWEAIATVALALFLVSDARAQAQVDYMTEAHSIVSGSFGGAFGADAADGSFGFDGAYDYLHNGRSGFEFLGSFTPDLEVNDFDTLQDNRVNTYMFNGIHTMPLGFNDRWLPYVSGGVGLMTLRGRVETDDDDFDALGLPLVDDNQFGGNVGFGAMGFMNHIGVRADVRYFTGIGNAGDVDDPTGSTLNSHIGDVNFWRTTVGLSYRW